MFDSGGRNPALLALLLLVMAAGCAGLPGERWEVRSLEALSRGSVSVQASSEGHTLYVVLTLHPPAAEDAYVTDVFLTMGRAGVGEARPRLRAEEVQPLGRYRGPVGLGFVYSSGDVDRYVARHTREGYYGTGGSSGPQRLQAAWTLVGPWAEAPELELVVVVTMGVYPRTGDYTEEVLFCLIRPRSQAEGRPHEGRR